DIIFYNSPNMIFILDEDLCVLQINPSAEMTFNTNASDIKNLPLNFLLDHKGFSEVKKTRKNDLNRRISYKEFGLIVMQSTIFLPKDNQILVIISDITEEENRRNELQSMKENTIAITNKVIEKQMRVAHEIASLLGETTAETKIALNKLKALVQEEGN
ncbi:MAG TPA: PAS domain-containing protein, partial [Bacteroidales bacterium]|nr:PAS domain-containing protein [Bacteroidales bacterium]